MRVYLPATTTLLRVLVDEGALPGPSSTAFAVTAGLRAWYTEGDEDELEYAANGQAVRASLRMVDADPTAARRRVVLAADVADSAITDQDELDRGAVKVAAVIELKDIVVIHIDDPEAQDTIARAAAVVLEADMGLESAQDVVDDAEGFELSWYATQELADLIATVEEPH